MSLTDFFVCLPIVLKRSGQLTHWHETDYIA
jgi:hypothetical protein